jgi:hypothetical protein
MDEKSYSFSSGQARSRHESFLLRLLWTTRLSPPVFLALYLDLDLDLDKVLVCLELIRIEMLLPDTC